MSVSTSRCHQGSHEETEDELRESGPDLACTDFLVAGPVHSCSEEDSHEEGDEADEDVLDHLDKDSGLFCLSAEGGTCNGNSSGRINGTTDEGTAHYRRHPGCLDDDRFEDHHQHSEYDGYGHCHRKVGLLAVGGFSRIFVSSFSSMDLTPSGIEVVKVADVPQLVRTLFK